jgi:RHS repeat-associated protein
MKNEAIVAMSGLALQLACTPTSPPQAATTTSNLDPLPTQEIVPSEPIGVTPVTHELTPSGAVKLTVDIKVPAGRAGMGPDVDLVYDSNRDNGLVGVGWEVAGTSSITRCPKIAAIDGGPEPIHYDASDRYCLDGQRLVVVAGTYGYADSEYRTEGDTFVRVIAEGDPAKSIIDAWRVYYPDGRIARYGSMPATRFEGAWVSYSDPVTPVATVHDNVRQAWMLDELRDRSDNTIVYEYEKVSDPEDAQAYEMRPSRILYTGHVVAPARREVRFVYQDRADRIDSWIAGLHRRETKRLSNIETYVSGALVRRYSLAYETKSITKRSLLASLTECDGANVCLPKTSFTWEYGSWDHDVIDTGITDAGVHLASANRLHVADVDGDGRDDILYPDGQNHWWIRYSTGDGFGPRTDAGLPHLGDNIASIVRIHDFDRDGKIDVLTVACKTSTDCPTYAWALYQWNGVKFTRRFDTTFGSGESVEHNIEPFLLDLDGDGLADMLQPDSSGFQWFEQRFNGTTWSPLSITGIARTEFTHGYRVFDHDGDGRSELMRRDKTPPPLANSLTAIARTRTGQWVDEPTNLPCSSNSNECSWREDFRQPDFNGDGLEDAVFPWGGDATTFTLNSRVNSGQGFGPDQPGPSDYAAPTHFEHALLGGTSGVITDDMNNDGRDDLVVLYTNAPTNGPGTGIEIYRSTGSGFARQDLPYSAGTLVSSGWNTTRTADIDGDGLRDIVQLVDGQLRILRRRGGHPDLITAVTPKLVGTMMRFAYTDIGEPGIHTRATNCGLPTRCAVRGVTVVTDAWLANGVSGENHLSIRYGGGRRDLKGRGFVGFASRTVTDDARSLVTTTTYHNQPLSGYYTYAGLPLTVSDHYTLASARKFDRVVTNLWGDTGMLASIHHPFLAHSTTQYFDRPIFQLPDPPFRTIEQSWLYDAYGNVTHSEAQVVGGSSEVVDVSYENRTVPWLLRLPTNTATTRCTAGTCVTRSTSASFDALGRLAYADRESPAEADAYRRTSVVERDVFGNVTVTSSATTLGTRSVTLSYDTEGVFLDEVVDALGQHRRIEIDSALGVLTEVVDPNGVSQYAQYDRFGRLRGHKREGGATTTINYLEGMSHPLAIRQKSIGGDDETVQLDKLGRIVEQTTHGLDGDVVTRELTYDQLGNLASRSRGRFTGAATQVSSYEHDQLGRITRVAAPDGTAQSVSYAKLETARFDAFGRRTRAVSDLDGRLSRVYEPDPGNPDGEIVTQYFQGPSGIDQVIDPLGNRTTFQYDQVGRRTYVEDGDRGGSTYSYNGFDEITGVTHADGTITAYEHDAGGRVTKIDSTDGTTSYVYDAALNGIGLLAEATSATGIVTRFAYDSDGRPIETSWDIDGESFSISRGYDGFGRQMSTTYPAISGVAPVITNNVYDGYGHLREVMHAGETIWRANVADAEGHLKEVELGNGVIERRTFDVARGWLDTLTTLAPDGATLQAMTYDYDVAGKLDSSNDLLTGRVETYSYDRLDRLATWSVGTGGTTLRRTRFEYDHIGNLLGENVELGPGDDVIYQVGQHGLGPHQLAHGPEGNYEYDKRGRQVAGPTRLVEFSDFDLPLRIEHEGAVTTFKYDAFRRRVVKAAEDEVTTSLDGLYERRVPVGGRPEHRCHVRAAGRTVADIVIDEGSGDERVRYLHADRIGSIAMTTDDNGQVVERFRFDPWGRRVTDADVPEPISDARRGDVRQGFTGHDHDDELGLVDMKGRIYDPHTRRFLSGDPVVVDPVSSQAWNRYSYVRNNPLRSVDPTGFYEEAPRSGPFEPEDESDDDPNQESEPADSTPACEPDPVKQECPGGCSSPSADEEKSSDQGVGDETSDSAEVEPKAPPGKIPWMNEAKSRNERQGGKGVIYVLDHAEAKYEQGENWPPDNGIKGWNNYIREEVHEFKAMRDAVALARAAGYTVVWVREGIAPDELLAVIEDDDTVGFVLDAHGWYGQFHLDGRNVWFSADQIVNKGHNLEFAVFVACGVLQRSQDWALFFDGVDVEAVWDTTSWGDWADTGRMERVFSEHLDPQPQ